MFLLSYFKKAEEKKEKSKMPFSMRQVFFCVLIVTLLAVLTVYRVNHVPSKAYCEDTGEYSLSASTDREREEFFAQFGFTAQSICHSLVRVPSQGEVFEEYNALQKAQGLDLRPFMGKSAHQYVLRLEKAEEETPLYAVMTVYKDKVIAFHLTDMTAESEIFGVSRL